jgi:hypothetical protein
MTLREMILGVLREHPRSISTISWGIQLLFGEEVDAVLLICGLEQLEREGLAERVVDGTWWKNG